MPDANSNAKQTKTRKSSIHVALSKECKAMVIREAAKSIRSPGQQIEYILGLYYSMRDDAGFQEILKSFDH